MPIPVVVPDRMVAKRRFQSLFVRGIFGRLNSRFFHGIVDAPMMMKAGRPYGGVQSETSRVAKGLCVYRAGLRMVSLVRNVGGALTVVLAEFVPSHHRDLKEVSESEDHSTIGQMRQLPRTSPEWEQRRRSPKFGLEVPVDAD